MECAWHLVSESVSEVFTPDKQLTIHKSFWSLGMLNEKAKFYNKSCDSHSQGSTSGDSQRKNASFQAYFSVFTSA